MSVCILMFGIGWDFIIKCQKTCNHINPNDFMLLILIIKKNPFVRFSFSLHLFANQINKRLHILYFLLRWLNILVAVAKSQWPEISPGFFEHDPLATFIEKESKHLSTSIPHLLIFYCIHLYLTTVLYHIIICTFTE